MKMFDGDDYPGKNQAGDLDLTTICYEPSREQNQQQKLHRVTKANG